MSQVIVLSIWLSLWMLLVFYFLRVLGMSLSDCKLFKKTAETRILTTNHTLKDWGEENKIEKGELDALKFEIGEVKEYETTNEGILKEAYQIYQN